MSEKHIIVLDDLKVTVRVKEEPGCIDMHHHFSRALRPDEVSSFEELTWRALGKWDENPKPNRITTNLSPLEQWVYAHPDDIKNGMQTFKDKNKNFEK